jgi:hypothetical protein
VPHRETRTGWRSSAGPLNIVKVGRHDVHCFLAGHHWNDFECDTRTAPFERLLLKQAQIVASHQLEAAREVRFDPAVNVLEAFGKHASLGADALMTGTMSFAAKRSMTMNSMLAGS